MERELQQVQVRPVPRQEKCVVMLTPAERYAMLSGEIIKTPLIGQRQRLLYRPAEVGQFLCTEGINALTDVKPGGCGIRRRPCG